MKRTIKTCLIAVAIFIAIYTAVSFIIANRVEKAIEIVYNAHGIYDESYSEYFDEDSFRALSSDLLFYYQEELEGDFYKNGKSVDYIIDDLDISVMPIHLFFTGEAKVSYEYSISYNGKIYNNYNLIENSRNVEIKFENLKYKIYFTVPV